MNQKNLAIRALHIDTGQGWRGGQQQAFYLHSMMSEKQIKSIMICQPDSEMAKKCKTDSLPYIAVKMRNELDLLAVLKIIKLVRKEQINIVHCHCAHSLSLGIICKTFLRKIILIASRRVDFAIKQNILSKFKYNTKLVDKIVCISQNIQNIMHASGIDKNKLILIHSGVDTNRYKDLSDAHTPPKLAEYIPTKKIIGTIAALTGHKDYPTLLRAIHLIAEERDDFVFVALGDGKDKDKILALRDELGLADKIIFTGYRSNVKDYLAHFDYFVLASKKEGLGTSVLDAMSANIPIIACASGGIPEMIKHEINGLLAEKRNPEDLAQKIIYALDHPEQMKVFAEKSLPVLDSFSRENTVNKNLELYRKLLFKRENGEMTE
ncbi:MAG TPA: glycosyltransferase [Candidatus Cloacimonadota bacterium]|nr:glycosyltransferase [Candidatus Cloacimonadota bacterium]HQB40851.1 glycosyltransferase [Candidatus Cloacimonadota bacterium]